MTQQQFKQELSAILDTASSKGNASEAALLVIYGRVLQAGSDGTISIGDARELAQRFGGDFMEKYSDAIDTAISGLNGQQLDELVAK